MIYKMSNPKDIPNMLKYGKARGKYLLHKLLPKLSDINELYVIENYEDYLKISEELPERAILRADAELGKTPTLGVRGCALEKNKIPEYIIKVKEHNKDGAVLCINTKIENEKLNISGSFNIHFEFKNCIIIEYLSEEFDIGGITKGEDVHEIYSIPWDEILFVKNINKYKIYNITEEDYKASALRKIKTLEEEQAKTIPLKYKPINIEIHRMIYEKIIIPILKDYNFDIKNFGIQGMIRKSKEGYILQPIELEPLKDTLIKIFTITI